jgi:glucokinase
MNGDQTLLLAGDIGGTHTRLQLWKREEATFRLIARGDYESQVYPDLAPIIKDFLARHSGKKNLQPNAACFGVAGPVQGGKAKLTNLPWLLDEAKIMLDCGISQVKLINDFEAAG